MPQDPAGLISRSQDAQRRPRLLEPERPNEIGKWLGTYREFWDASLSRLDDYLDPLQAKEKPRERKKAPNRRRAW